MKSLFLALAIVAVSALTACSKTETPPTATAPAPQTYDLVAANAKGFTVGALMSVNTVYVLFDPQCPHCGHLWAAAQPLLNKAKFVWIPVAILNGNSVPQGATLLGASNPVDAMNLHEASLLAGTGGTVPSTSTPVDLEAAIKKNTELFTSLKLESVPFLVAHNAKTGQVVSNSGAMDTASLAQLLGLNAN